MEKEGFDRSHVSQVTHSGDTLYQCFVTNRKDTTLLFDEKFRFLKRNTGLNDY